MTDFTKQNLAEIQDMAPGFGMEDTQEARFAGKALDAEQLGLAYLRVKPGKTIPFAHRHEHQEELYVVVAGSGSIKLDDEDVPLSILDAVRIAPHVTRTLSAGDDGLDVVCFGAPALSEGKNDGIMLDPDGNPVNPS